MGLRSNTLSTAEARRIALAAQGLARPNREGKANWSRIAKAVDAMQLLQIDSVNVLVRSHYLPVFARVGHYDQASLDQRTFSKRKRAFFEYWAHEASLLPLSMHRLMRWSMARAKNSTGQHRYLARFGKEEHAYVQAVLDHIRSNGAVSVSDLPDPGGRSGQWWGWSKGKTALEYLFDTGEVTTATRKGFERIYDLTERVIPAEILNAPAPNENDAISELIDLSGQALGIATDTDLRDYFRLPVDGFRKALPDVIETGRLIPVKVEGWKAKTFLHADAKLPRRVSTHALLSPFDPIVWERGRTERLFDFRYRIEIYTPQPKRVFGYYVLPFLEGDRLTSRVCLKADRFTGTLRVNTAHAEKGIDKKATAAVLAPELRRMAAWLGLENIEAAERGDLAKPLRAALKQSA
jgi:uncharacterized protein YcaQ